uniref:Uncharacterized protein n=1 Tax=Romanomermis culicivorax TaxID=13658 RepID=A0A915IR20_ROMCU
MMAIELVDSLLVRWFDIRICAKVLKIKISDKFSDLVLRPCHTSPRGTTWRRAVACHTSGAVPLGGLPYFAAR